MKSFRRPSPETIRAFLEGQARLGFTYEAVGATAGEAPKGYALDHARVRIGRGRAAFERARDALRRWDQFRQVGWVEVMPGDAEFRVGGLLAVVARRAGIWWSNACRIVYVVDEDAPVHRFGVAYGTLPDHAESGEERFLVEWDPETDDVHYDVLAFSHPYQFLTRLGYYYVRHSQKRFAKESCAVMARIAGESGADDGPVSDRA